MMYYGELDKYRGEEYDDSILRFVVGFKSPGQDVFTYISFPDNVKADTFCNFVRARG